MAATHAQRGHPARDDPAPLPGEPSASADVHCCELVRHSDRVFWLLSLSEQRVLYASPAYETVWGRAPDTVCGRREGFLLGVHPEDAAQLTAAIARLPGEVTESEYRVVRPDGSERWVCSRWFPAHQTGGAGDRVIGITEDITRRKWADVERERILEAVAHDLRSPLTGMMLSADTALAVLAGEGSPAVVAALQRILIAAEHMQEVIGGLLDASALAGGGVLLRPQECDLDGLVHTALTRMQPLAHAKGVSVKATVGSGLRAHADPERLLQVLANLLGNAVKFTPSGGDVEVCVERRGSQVWVSVSDSGPGIAERHIPSIFDRYWRKDHSSSEGAGLGLAIAKRIVDAHGGKIWVASRAEQGSTFIFSLPAGHGPDAL